MCFFICDIYNHRFIILHTALQVKLLSCLCFLAIVKKMLRSQCCVPGCRKTLNQENVILHSFPRKQELRRKWLENIGSMELKTKTDVSIRAYRVCNDHFEDVQFQTSEKVKLNRGAIPTLKLTLPRCEDGAEAELDLASQECAKLPNTTTPLLDSGTENIITVSNVSTTSNPNTAACMTPAPSTSRQCIQDINIPTTSQSYTTTSITPPPSTSTAGKKSHKILRHIGISSTQLTPKKKYLYKEIIKCKRSLNYFQKQLKVKRKVADDSLINYIIKNVKRHQNRLSEYALIFIQSQFKVFKKKAVWSSKEKALFLALYKKSPKTYRFLQSIFNLPSRSTLMRSLATINIKVGINHKILKYLNSISKALQPINRFGVLIFDEMKLKPHLQLNKSSLSGLVQFESGPENKIADHVLVFMLRIINKKWQQPIAYYFVQSTTPSFILKNLITTIIKTLHQHTAFRILATVSDQGSTNVKAIKELANSNSYQYRILNYDLVHIFDPPHLLKGVRNLFLTKNILFNGNLAKFTDIETLYKIDAITPDGKICPKLTEEHINPKGRRKMKVKLAAQLFSNNVYAGLSFAAKCGVLSDQNTATFVLFMDRVFNSLNSVFKSKKPLNGPLTHKSSHLQFWIDAKKKLQNVECFDRFNGNRVSAPPSIRNLVVTIANIELLWKRLRKLGFRCLATRTLNQDPLENFFGYIRGLCGQNMDPTTHHFSSAFKTAIINNILIHSISGNCENANTQFLCSLEDLMEDVTKSKDTPVPSTSKNVQTLPATPQLREISHTIYSEMSQLSIDFRFQTSAYIAGFIANKFLKKQYCHSCANFMLSESKADEDYTLIILKDYGNQLLRYPSKNFVNIINLLKKQIMQLFPTCVTNF